MLTLLSLANSSLVRPNGRVAAPTRQCRKEARSRQLIATQLDAVARGLPGGRPHNPGHIDERNTHHDEGAGMSRKLRWILPMLALLLMGGLAARTMKARQLHNEAALAAAKAPPALDLSAADLSLATPLEMARTVAVSGGLKAVNTAVVKAKVAAEVKSLGVREGDTVRAGQVIGQLDTTELDWRLRQAEQTARPGEHPRPRGAGLHLVHRTGDLCIERRGGTRQP